jgi:GT2 family glycosyltransferase
MIHKKIFEGVGLFDESFSACEDYDLWLRITAHYPAYLIPQFLVIKRGGHPDQLSRNSLCLDKWRIKAIKKLLDSNTLNLKQYKIAIKELCVKCQIYACGCLKRGKTIEASYYFSIYDNYTDKYSRK